MKYVVKKTVVFYAEVEADSETAALAIAEEQGQIELDAEAVEGDWELAAG